jgi:hypothetical protein
MFFNIDNDTSIEITKIGENLFYYCEFEFIFGMIDISGEPDGWNKIISSEKTVDNCHIIVLINYWLDNTIDEKINHDKIHRTFMFLSQTYSFRNDGRSPTPVGLQQLSLHVRNS